MKKSHGAKIRSGVAQIIEGRNLLEHAKMDGQMRLKLTEYMKEFIEIGEGRNYGLGNTRENENL